MVNGPQHVYSSAAASSSGRTHASSTTRISCASSTRSCRRSAAASTRRRRWSTRACPTAAASTRSSRRSRSRGPTLTIRKFSRDPYTINDLITFGTLTARVGAVPRRCVKGKLNILISGGTGTGKTTTLNALSAFNPGRRAHRHDRGRRRAPAPAGARDHARVAAAEHRGQGEVQIRELVRNALRMRPDRIIVGEVRGAETLDMLQAMNTGHDGSLTTIHANSPRDALSPPRDDRADGRRRAAAPRDPRADLERVRRARPDRAPRRRLPPHHAITEVLADGVGRDHAPGHLRRVVADGGGCGPREAASHAAARDRDQPALPREARGEQRRAAAGLLRARGRRRSGQRSPSTESAGPSEELGLLAALVAAGLVSAQAATAGVRIRSVDTSAYPQVRVTVVTSGGYHGAAPRGERQPARRAARPSISARRRASSSSVDHSQSMAGATLRSATAAARAFVAAKRASDRVEVVAVRARGGHPHAFLQLPRPTRTPR